MRIQRMDESTMTQVSMYVNIVLSVLFFVSEALPFVHHNDYNGVFDLIHKRFFKCNAVGGGTSHILTSPASVKLEPIKEAVDAAAKKADEEERRMEFID